MLYEPHRVHYFIYLTVTLLEGTFSHAIYLMGTHEGTSSHFIHLIGPTEHIIDHLIGHRGMLFTVPYRHSSGHFVSFYLPCRHPREHFLMLFMLRAIMMTIFPIYLSTRHPTGCINTFDQP